MPDALESALIIELAGTFQWDAALPPLNRFTGTLTGIDPGQPLDITQYARRDREFQHRDMINAAAAAKVSIYARTVWNGTVVQPILPGVTQVTDSSGTNVTLPLDPSQAGASLPNSSTAVQYVLNADVPYAAVQVTDVDLYNRDLLLFETLARAAAIFTTNPPINPIDPDGNYIGSTSVWATAQGTNTPAIPNAAKPLSQPTLKDPDLYLAERDNQVAAYVARVTQALKNPFAYASRIYVQIDASGGGDTQESETYVLTDNLFISGNTYTAGEQVLYSGAWYQAINTTTDTPPSSNWSAIDLPTQRQFLADPSLDSRNRIVYDTVAQTLQWFRETLDLVHIPQIVGFYVPGIFPDQTIQTVAAVPERKDAQFYRQKSSRVEFATGTFASQQVFDPTGNRNTNVTYVTGGLNTVFQDDKHVTLPIPDSFTVNFRGLICTSGTYALDCLVRPSPSITIAGGDNDQGSVDTLDGGTTYSMIGDVRNWEIALPAGGWNLFIDFANFSATPAASFGIKGSQGATAILASTLPLYYTDNNGNGLPEYTVISSPAIAIQSTGQTYNFSIQWTSGSGLFHVARLRFEQVNGPDTSHYIMQAAWLNALSNTATQVVVPGGSAQGATPTGDGGVDFPALNSVMDWLVTLPNGNWQMTINYSNVSATTTSQFGIAVTVPNVASQSFTLPYTDSGNVPLPEDTIVTSQTIGVQSNGQQFDLGIKWASGSGQLHIKDLTFTLISSQDSVSKLDVIGQTDMSDVMPFRFYLAGTDLAPQMSVTWLPKSASIWQAKSYLPGDQVLYNLVYWQATASTSASDVPGQSPLWTQIGQEPQIPLLFEQIQLSKLVETVPTPEVVGFQGFRQDMLERALRADQDAYTRALSQVGTNFPEFRDSDDSWTLASTGSWMTFIEVYQPRLRQAGTVASGDIVQDRQYEVVTQTGESVTYNGVIYSNGQKFYGIEGLATYDSVGQPIVNQVGAYRLSRPADIGKTGLVPAGIEYMRTAGTGTVHGWYPSYASYPTHQAILPWMIEQGFYAADDDFQSPDGNASPPAAPDNPPVQHATPPVPPPAMSVVFIPENVGVSGFKAGIASANGLVYCCTTGGSPVNFFSTSDGNSFSTLGSAVVSGNGIYQFIFAGGQFVAVGDVGKIITSPDANTWTPQSSPTSSPWQAIAYGAGKYVAVSNDGTIISSSNGALWSVVAATSDALLHVVFGNSVFVAAGLSGAIYTSPNGSSWTQQSSGIAADINGIAFGLDKFAVITNDDNLYASSNNGVSWIPMPVPPVYSQIAFGNNTFVVCDGSQIWDSGDLSTWGFVTTNPTGYALFQLIYYTGSTFAYSVTFD